MNTMNTKFYRNYVISLLEADIEAVKMCLSGYSGAESAIESLYPELPEGVDYFRVQAWMRLINYQDRSKRLWSAASAAYPLMWVDTVTELERPLCLHQSAEHV